VIVIPIAANPVSVVEFDTATAEEDVSKQGIGVGAARSVQSNGKDLGQHTMLVMIHWRCKC
jgi:hypothetical protein